MIGDMVTTHVAASAGLGGVVLAAVYGVVEDLSSLPTVGVGAAGMFMLAMVGLLFRSQQEQIKHQAERIASLEQELDAMRRESVAAVRRADASARRADGMQTEITDLGMRPDNRA
jgi:Tfp pilus assembly protein PilN